MKKRVVAVIMLFAMLVTLSGCDNMKIPFLSKPEDAVDEFMKQENLMKLLADLEDDDSEEVMSDYIGVQSIKSLLLENIRTISYTVTDVSENGNTATITTLITHLDISPLATNAFTIFFEKLLTIDEDDIEIPETEEESMELLNSMLQKAFIEAATQIEPTETYTKIKFKCVKQSGNKWEVQETPDEFVDRVLLMNLYITMKEAIDSYDDY